MSAGRAHPQFTTGQLRRTAAFRSASWNPPLAVAAIQPDGRLLVTTTGADSVLRYGVMDSSTRRSVALAGSLLASDCPVAAMFQCRRMGR
jgi:hypothetical protein